VRNERQRNSWEQAEPALRNRRLLQPFLWYNRRHDRGGMRKPGVGKAYFLKGFLFPNRNIMPACRTKPLGLRNPGNESPEGSEIFSPDF